MKKITMLGCGMVGRAMAMDLCHDFEVTVTDINQERLDTIKKELNVETRQGDLRKASVVQEFIAEADLVIDAVPGFMGFQTMKTVIEAGKNIADIAFYGEDPFDLDDLAKQKGVVAVMDCGVAPGMSNMILGHHNQNMEIDSFECLVGGLPKKRSWPYEYKAPFSPIDVIEEYIRPARFMRDSKIVTRPALSDVELVDFDEIGTLEAFNTDGLRSLLKTIPAPNMIEKTMRYPGHVAIMEIFKATGLFNEEPVSVNGTEIRPIDLTTQLLFPMWKLGDTEEELTVMRITVKGQENGKEKAYQYHMLDRYDPKTKVSSMARTTGYPCTAVSRLILDGKYTRKGISPPEFVGEVSECFDFAMAYLKERNIHFVLK